jgi:hypothetical protein
MEGVKDRAQAAAPAKRHDALCSFAERVEQLEQRNPMTERTRANLVRALESIDPASRDVFIERHRAKLGDIETLAAVKYADIGYWAHRNVLLAQWLELDNKPPLDILDIGMGSGNFGMVAQSMGHSSVGTDVFDPWYAELCELMRVERVIAPVTRGELYKPVDRKFDLITMMLPAFHKKTVNGKREHWSVEDWRLFLLGLVEDLLKPGGAIFILMPLDKDGQGGLSYSPLVEWSRERGARLDRTFPKGPVRHILFDPATEETFGEQPPEVVEKSDIELDDPMERFRAENPGVI